LGHVAVKCPKEKISRKVIKGGGRMREKTWFWRARKIKKKKKSKEKKKDPQFVTKRGIQGKKGGGGGSKISTWLKKGRFRGGHRGTNVQKDRNTRKNRKKR